MPKHTAQFSEDLGAFQAFVGSFTCSGGRDLPEDVAAGLHRATRMDWSARARVLFHIADAPCHGTDFHDLGSDRDDYPNGGANARRIAPALRYLADHDTFYTFVAIQERRTRKMVAEFERLGGLSIGVESINDAVEIEDIVVQATIYSGLGGVWADGCFAATIGLART